jgi:hypothetical protein
MQIAKSLLVLLSVLCGAALALPQLVVGGFSWAENLCFDGRGSLFVSEHVRGQLVRIYLSGNGTRYDSTVHLDAGFKHFGGLAATADGATLYAAVTFADGTAGIIATPTAPAPAGGGGAAAKVLAHTPHQGNGLALNEATGTIYITREGWVDKGAGSVLAVDVATGSVATVASGGYGYDGCWLDARASLLYVSMLVTKKVLVIDISASPTGRVVGLFDGLSALPTVSNLLDDLTLTRNGTATPLNATVVIGADFLGKAVRMFRLDGVGGSEIVDPPSGIELKQPTSARWGKGPGFDPASIYVTEGGGVLKSQRSRRVIQFPGRA